MGCPLARSACQTFDWPMRVEAQQYLGFVELSAVDEINLDLQLKTCACSERDHLAFVSLFGST
jgi:hypothetical protein